MKGFNLSILGFVAGFASASLGIGGGVVLVSSLVLFFGYEIKKAIGTSLATTVPTAFVGITTHYIVESSNIKVLIALLIVAGSIVGAKIGVKLANALSSIKLKKIFALLLLLVGLKLAGIINISTGSVLKNAAYPLLIMLGLVAGSLSALFGIGGGIIMVPMLFLFFGLSIHEAIPTSLLVIFPTTLAGAVFHKKFDNINTEALRFLAPLALIGAVIGAIVTNSLPSAVLGMVFGCIMILCSVQIFLEKQ